MKLIMKSPRGALFQSWISPKRATQEIGTAGNPANCDFFGFKLGCLWLPYKWPILNPFSRFPLVTQLKT